MHYSRLMGTRASSLTVTARGQVTFRKDILKHLGVEPGDKIHLDLLPDGRAELSAESRTRSVRDLHGLLAGKTRVRLSIEEIGEAIAEAGAKAGAGEE